MFSDDAYAADGPKATLFVTRTIALSYIDSGRKTNGSKRDPQPNQNRARQSASSENGLIKII